MTGHKKRRIKVSKTSQTYTHSLNNPELRALYEAAGFAGRVGWGKSPALLVIDMAGAWANPDELIGTDLTDVEENVLKVLKIAREKNLPIIFTTMSWDPSLAEIGKVVRMKTPHSERMLHNTENTELKDSMERQPDEPLVVKPRASAFFGTNVEAMLTSAGVDTTIVVGVSTSGCIRGTAESAFNRGYHVVVPLEAVGDRSESAHEANIFDIDARYGDVMPVADVIDHLQKMPERSE